MAAVPCSAKLARGGTRRELPCPWPSTTYITFTPRFKHSLGTPQSSACKGGSWKELPQVLSAPTSWESCGHPKSLGDTPLLKNLLTGVIQWLLAIPPESSCYLKNVQMYKSPSAGQGWGGMTSNLKFKAFFQKTHFFVYFKHDVPSWKSCFPCALLFMHREGGSQTQATANCGRYSILGMSLRKIFLLKSFMIETRGN